LGSFFSEDFVPAKKKVLSKKVLSKSSEAHQKTRREVVGNILHFRPSSEIQ
jgi:hypothetical protein